MRLLKAERTLACHECPWPIFEGQPYVELEGNCYHLECFYVKYHDIIMAAIQTAHDVLQQIAAELKLLKSITHTQER